jgi:hypothetical protein
MQVGDVLSMAGAVSNGSPALIHAVGRMYGLGQAEREQLSVYGIPGWVWGVALISAGVIIGVRVQKNWPDKVPSIIQGK